VGSCHLLPASPARGRALRGALPLRSAGLTFSTAEREGCGLPGGVGKTHGGFWRAARAAAGLPGMLPASRPGFPPVRRRRGLAASPAAPVFTRLQRGSTTAPSPALARGDAGTSAGAGLAAAGVSGVPRSGERILTRHQPLPAGRDAEASHQAGVPTVDLGRETGGGEDPRFGRR